MRGKEILKFAILMLSLPCLGQRNLPTIDKPQYNNQFRLKGAFSRIALPEKTARKMSAPILLNGFLLVYNEDLGYFNQHPDGVISQLNAQRRFGRDNWRIPTPDELSMMEDNSDRLGMGSDIYMCTTYANGTLRLVSTEGDYSDLVRVGNTYWMKTNLGASEESDSGVLVTYEEAVRNCPKGYRLPTKQEYDQLIALGKACFGGYYGASRNNALLYFPFSRTNTETYYVRDYFNKYTSTIGEGNYWTSSKSAKGHPCFMEFSYNITESEKKTEPTTRNESNTDRMSVRYVLDK